MKNNKKRFWCLVVVAVMIACGASTLMSDYTLQASSKKKDGSSSNSSQKKETVAELVLPAKDCSVKVKASLPDTVKVGDTVTLKASLKGFDKVDYTIQWQYGKEKDGKVEWKDVSGEKGKSMNVTLTSKNSKYQWRVVVKAGGEKYKSSAYTIKNVKDEGSSTSSENRKITVKATLPENLQLGDTITLKASLSGFGSESYTLQWQKGKPNDAGKTEWKDMDGENGKKLSVKVTEKSANYRYRIVAKVDGKTVKSSSYKMNEALAAIHTMTAAAGNTVPEGTTAAIDGENERTKGSAIDEQPAATEAPIVTEAPVVDAHADEKVTETEAPVAEEPVEPETPVAEEPAETEAPVVEEPVEAEAPVAEEPVETEAPVAEEPAENETPVAEEPVVTEASVVEEPAETETPVVEEPVEAEAPVVEEPAETETPVVEEPAEAETPVVEEPVVTETPVVEEPAETETPVVEEPVVTEAPAVEEPVVTEAPVVEEPVVTETPAVEETVVTEAPVVEEPVVTEAPVVEEPVVTETPAVEEPVVTEAPVVEEPVETEAPVVEEPVATKEPAIEDQLDPNRSIDVRIVSWDGEIGHKATLRAMLKGYDNAVYTITWKTSKDNVNWQYLDGEHGETLSFDVTLDNCTNYWNVDVVVTGIR